MKARLNLWQEQLHLLKATSLRIDLKLISYYFDENLAGVVVLKAGVVGMNEPLLSLTAKLNTFNQVVGYGIGHLGQ